MSLGAIQALRSLPRPMIWRRTLALWLAAAAAVVVVLSVLFLTVLPRAGFYATFVVLSDSMEPAIRIGSVVVVVPVRPDTLAAGDVISYTSADPPHPTLTHRIQSVVHESDGRIGFKTKGDFNLVEDPYTVHFAGMGGRVVLSVPLVGFLIAALTTSAARWMLGLLLAALLGLFWFRALWAKPVDERAFEPGAPAFQPPTFQPRSLAALPAYPPAPMTQASPVIRFGILVWLVAGLISRLLGKAR